MATSAGSLARASKVSSPPGPRSSSARRRSAQAPGVDLGVVVSADEVDGLQVGHRRSVGGGSGRAALSARCRTRTRRSVHGERDRAVAVGAVGRHPRAPQRGQGGRRRVPVGVRAHLDRRQLGPQAGEHLGKARVGAAVVGHLHGVHVGKREREQRLALGVGGEQQVGTRRCCTTATTPRGFGSSGGGPGGRGGGESTSISSSPPARLSLSGAIAGTRADVAGGRLPQHRPEARDRAVPSPPSTSSPTGKRRSTSSSPP